jgi:hypothetical protein
MPEKKVKPTESASVAAASVPVEPTQPVTAGTPTVTADQIPATGERGVKGWLVFWLIAFGLATLWSLGWFFGVLATLVDGDGSAESIVTLCITPFIAASAITAIVMILTEKKLGRLFAQLTLLLAALWATILIIVGLATYCSGYEPSTLYGSWYTYHQCSVSGGQVVMGIGGILISWLAAVMMSLYFTFNSRVKNTLVK